MYTTAVAAPSQPDPPMLSEQFVSALTLSWIRRPGDDVFLLHMDDESKVRQIWLLFALVFHVTFCQYHSCLLLTSYKVTAWRCGSVSFIN